MNIDAKLLNKNTKYLQARSSNTLKISYTMIKWNIFHVYKDTTIFTNHKCDTSHRQNVKQKLHDHINRCRKSI